MVSSLSAVTLVDRSTSPPPFKSTSPQLSPVVHQITSSALEEGEIVQVRVEDLVALGLGLTLHDSATSAATSTSISKPVLSVSVSVPKRSSSFSCFVSFRSIHLVSSRLLVTLC
jgi:hypothetical protein